MGGSNAAARVWGRSPGALQPGQLVEAMALQAFISLTFLTSPQIFESTEKNPTDKVPLASLKSAKLLGAANR